MSAVDPTTAPHPPRTTGIGPLWAGVVGPPLLWLAHLQINYMTVPLACRRDAPILVHGVTLLTILFVAGLGALALGSWRRAGREWPDSSGGALSQDRFLAAMGLLLAALVIMALIAQWLPSFFVDPCR